MHLIAGFVIAVAMAAIAAGMEGGGLFVIGALLLFGAACFGDYRLRQARAEIARLQAELEQDRGPPAESEPSPEPALPPHVRSSTGW